MFANRVFDTEPSCTALHMCHSPNPREAGCLRVALPQLREVLRAAGGAFGRLRSDQIA